MSSFSRRTFLHHLLGAGSSAFLLSLFPPALRDMRSQEPDPDEEIFRKTFAWATAGGFAGKSVGEITGRIGMSFIGSPYVEHPLDGPGEEHLIVNLRAFDCVTFVESSLALARCVKAMASSYQDYSRELRQVRYRGGVIKGYASRLHYFSEWIRDNEHKRVVKDMTQSLGGQPYRKPLDFMTTHRSSYPQLADEVVYRQILATEQGLLQYPLWSIPKSVVAKAQRKLRSGDIVAIATSIGGLDVSHTGLAVVDHGAVRFLHAPLSGGTVTVSTGSLADYIDHLGVTSTGIMVARPQDP